MFCWMKYMKLIECDDLFPVAHMRESLEAVAEPGEAMANPLPPSDEAVCEPKVMVCQFSSEARMAVSPLTKLGTNVWLLAKAIEPAVSIDERLSVEPL